jgi:hypothetical protein
VAGIEYEVLEAKNIETFREQLAQQGAKGWRLISMAVGPHGYFYAVMEKRSAT